MHTTASSSGTTSTTLDCHNSPEEYVPRRWTAINVPAASSQAVAQPVATKKRKAPVDIDEESSPEASKRTSASPSSTEKVAKGRGRKGDDNWGCSRCTFKETRRGDVRAHIKRANSHNPDLDHVVWIGAGSPPRGYIPGEPVSKRPALRRSAEGMLLVYGHPGVRDQRTKGKYD